jgi:hypothetical protein
MRERRARWTRQSAQLAALSLLLAAGFLCLASQALAQTACETTPATIERTALTEETPAGVGLEAEIDPHNGETTYEFAIVWRVLDPSERGERVPGDPRVQGGPIPAGAGAVTVSGFVSGLQPGYTYWYEVIASNLAGKTKSAAQWFSYYYTGGYPYGLGGGPPYESEVSPCSLESAQREAEAIYEEAEARRQQHAREAQQQLAREVAARYASEAAALKHREEEMAAAEVAVHVTSCVVPALRGHTLSAARRALEKAHCRIGEVRRPDHHRGALVIVGQSIRRGRKLAGGTAIAVTMGVRRVSALPVHVQ